MPVQTTGWGHKAMVGEDTVMQMRQILAILMTFSAGSLFIARPALGGEGLPSVAELIAAGNDVYVKHCASCHGDRLQGQENWRTRNLDGTLPAPPHDQTGHTWHHADWQLFEMTKTGRQPFAPAGRKNGMPAYADVLSDRQILAVLAFIKSTWPRRIQERQTDISRNTLR